MIPLFPEEKSKKKRENKYTFFERRERERQEEKGRVRVQLAPSRRAAGTRGVSFEGDLSAQLPSDI